MAPYVPIEYIGKGKLTTCAQVSSVVIMGKARKYSKGHSSGFGNHGLVLDYPQIIETIAESEGFGSSGRVDTELTASEGSYGPKRKSANLSIDTYDQYGVPFQVFSLSKLSPSEKRNLEKRFKSELERVKLLQKRIASMPNGTPFHFSSDIHRYNEGHVRPPLEHYRMSAEVSTSQGKKRGSAGKKGSHAKQSSVGRGVSKKTIPSNTSNAMLMKQCENLLNKLMTHPHGWVFNAPVDVVKLNIPDYFNVIKHPMDLGTIKNKLLSGEYLSPLDFAADVRLTFSNAKTYNPVGNDVHIMADILSKFFEARWKPIEKKVPVVIDAPVPSTSSVYVEPRNYTPMPPVKKRKTIPAETKVEREPVKRAVPVVDKQKLSLELEDLLAELPDNIIEFLKKQSHNDTHTDEDEIEIDIDALSDDTLLALRKLLDDYLMDKQKKQGRAEPCEMELHNESGFSNSSVQPPQGNELIDEDVDIGENDPPISSYPPVQIEKEENAVKPDKHSSSSSSSGSSSSDSDSGNSSGSESDGEKAACAAVSTKEVLGSGVDIEQKTKDMKNSDQQDNLLSGSNQVEQNSEPKEEPSAVAESHQEGENAPPGRQVSPDKLYRAALLRSRFADTIIKAKEKALDKGEKLDPEKLRLEKEELERRRVEEKARLQAEVKAAEEARRKAEADAAAEAKRKRDLEREAARLALQNMEKTVEINENSHFLEDLEMLRGEVEHLDSLVDEATPDLSKNDIMGSFKFQGNSNPLEQLGLYMKMDDEEDEDAEHQRPCAPDAVNENDDKKVLDDENENGVEDERKMDDDVDRGAEHQQALSPDARNETCDEKESDAEIEIEIENENGTEDGEMKMDDDVDGDAEHQQASFPDSRNVTCNEKEPDAESENENENGAEDRETKMDDDVDGDVGHQQASFPDARNETYEKEPGAGNENEIGAEDGDGDGDGETKMDDDIDGDAEHQQASFPDSRNVTCDEKVLDAENENGAEDGEAKIDDDVDGDAGHQQASFPGERNETCNEKEPDAETESENGAKDRETKMDDDVDGNVGRQQASFPDARNETCNEKEPDAGNENENEIGAEDGETKMDDDVNGDAEHQQASFTYARTETCDEKVRDAEIENGPEDGEMKMDDDGDRNAEHQQASFPDGSNETCNEKVLDAENENGAEDGGTKIDDDVDGDAEHQQANSAEIEIENENKNGTEDGGMKMDDDVEGDAGHQQVRFPDSRAMAPRMGR